MNRLHTRLSIKTAFVIAVFQMALMPTLTIAQSETNDIDVLNRRKLQAEVEQAEAAARKAEADAAKLRSDIAKQDIETRRAQIDALKGTSNVEGTFVENNIAASKALGCAAWNIAQDLEGSGTHPKLLLWHSTNAVNGLSEYSALLMQIRAAILNYHGGSNPATIGAIDAVTARLALYETQYPTTITDAEIEALKRRIKEIDDQIDEVLDPKPKVRAKGNVRIRKTSALLAKPSPSKGATSSFPMPDFLSTTTAGGMLVSSALTALAMFRTDINIKGETVNPGARDLMNHLYRTINLTAVEQPRQNKKDRPVYTLTRKQNPVRLIAADDIVLTNTNFSDSKLLQEFRQLGIEYFKGKQTSALVAAKKTSVIKRAEVTYEKDLFKAQQRLAEVRLSKATDDLATAGPGAQQRLAQARFDKSKLELALASMLLENAQKKIEAYIAFFDNFMSDSVAVLESLNQSADAMSKQLTGGGDKEAVYRALGTYLRSEVLYSMIEETSGDNVLWIDASVSANGGNQKKLSSPLFDIFTRGPGISYSGGSVVTYQLRNMKGEVKLAGTVWAYAPYRKTGNITQFECQDVRSGPGREPRPWSSL